MIKIDSSLILKNRKIGASCDYLNSISINFGVYMMYAPKKLFEQLKDLYLMNILIMEYVIIKK